MSINSIWSQPYQPYHGRSVSTLGGCGHARLMSTLRNLALVACCLPLSQAFALCQINKSATVTQATLGAGQVTALARQIEKMPPVFDLAITCAKGQRYILQVVATQPLNGFNDSGLLLNKEGASLGLTATLKTFESTRVERRFNELASGGWTAVGTGSPQMARVVMMPVAQGVTIRPVGGRLNTNFSISVEELF